MLFVLRNSAVLINFLKCSEFSSFLVAAGRRFHSLGAAYVKLRRPDAVSMNLMYSERSDESLTSSRSVKYEGVEPMKNLCISSR